ncbi:hypothetical protein SPBR_08915 [Sporothrix brasiliensis 5110]|uniref:SWR1-complex protein 3 domain-containing protein n=1 Tax=Sporothrix brasiliensis 5110 TaxID=1398154 RepID=A0A0C2IRR9_9PEZI|nr:uncharacterized protein SPBR_08915 [Sporothrix brasiliensis 5110]KIH87682.1 hypothetical protein SPBR_08915 [Sporothrix brasiliensis 5110]
MERKRKIPPRAAARVEQAAKRRTSTPPIDGRTTRSVTPSGGKNAAEDENQPPEPEAAAPTPQRIRLPRSINPGKPLPTVEKAQPEDLPKTEYQSVQESGVLAESLARSRSKWINEGIFERYWVKPSKRRGVAADDPKNPAKDSMVKLGQVLITVEPHTFEATMYGVRDPKPAAALPANRPVLMYGPSRGTMPPPSAPGTPQPKQRKPRKPKQPSQSPAPRTPIPATASLPATPDQKPVLAPTPQAIPVTPQQILPHQSPALAPAPAPTPISATAQAQAKTQAQTQPQTQSPAQPSLPLKTEQGPGTMLQSPIQAPSQPPTPSAGSSVLRPPSVTQRPPPLTALAQMRAGQPSPVAPSWAPPQPTPSPRSVEATSVQQPSPRLAPPSMSPVPGPPLPVGRPPSVPPAPVTAPRPSPSPAPTTPRTGAAQPPPGTDSIIVTLAQRAAHDPQLRDMMTRVANGQAPKDELDRFQAIINQITEENKRKGAADGPSADRLFVDGRTVRFFAEEVRIILDIVLRSNPKQKAFNLVPPEGSDQLVVLLVKKCLDDMRVRGMVRRIADNQAQFSDATDLKHEIDKLKVHLDEYLEKERKRQQDEARAKLATVPEAPDATVGGNAVAAATAKTNGATNGAAPREQSSTPPVTDGAKVAEKNQPQKETKEAVGSSQALRSRGPPPAPKLLDVSAVVFEFAGGTGDRYMFPKFSIVEYIPMPQGPAEAVASFLIVRKGSTSEYGGDPDLDYYQPITVRLQVSPLSNSQKLLDYLAKVVAPVEEVTRYMDNIMHSMTRAEFVLLAMRLPRRGPAGGTITAAGDEDKEAFADDGGLEAMDINVSKKASVGGGDSDSADANGDGSGGDEHYVVGHPPPLQGVLWATKAGKSTRSSTAAASSISAIPQLRSSRRVTDEDEQYQSFISGLIPKEVEEEA